MNSLVACSHVEFCPWKGSALQRTESSAERHDALSGSVPKDVSHMNTYDSPLIESTAATARVPLPHAAYTHSSTVRSEQRGAGSCRRAGALTERNVIRSVLGGCRCFKENTEDLFSVADSPIRSLSSSVRGESAPTPPAAPRPTPPSDILCSISQFLAYISLVSLCI